MRAFWVAGIFAASLAAGDDNGLPPRAKPSDYPAHESIKTAVLAAAIVPPEQVKKMFSSDIAKAYVVMEVALYPEDGHSVDVDVFDLALMAGDQMTHASKPRDIAVAWRGRDNPIGTRGPNVSTDTGVMVARGPDPVTGRPTTSVGTYEGVHVSNYPTPNSPAPPANGPDPSVVEDKIRRMALPEGLASKPVAGYVYFRYSPKKRDLLKLNYATDDLSVDLTFPK